MARPFYSDGTITGNQLEADPIHNIECESEKKLADHQVEDATVRRPGALFNFFLCL